MKEKIKHIEEKVESSKISTVEELEQFRIQFLGSKNVIKVGLFISCKSL